jgi:hypothetical protein
MTDRAEMVKLGRLRCAGERLRTGDRAGEERLSPFKPPSAAARARFGPLPEMATAGRSLTSWVRRRFTAV